MNEIVLDRSNAKAITKTLGGEWHGHYGTAPCPVCQPERRRDQNALTLSDGSERLLAHCKKSACAFRDILVAAGVASGSYAAPDPIAVAQLNAERRAAATERSRNAARIWRETRPIYGTLGEFYFRNRGVTCDLPGTLHYRSDCWHTPTRRYLPAVIALVQGGEGFSIHRTYLNRDGSGKAAVDRKDQKRTLGPIRGGAVRLTVGRGPLVVAEGIENGLSLVSGGFVEPDARVWAALSTSGMRRLNLPRNPGRLVIALDHDQAGRAAADTLAARAHAQGWRVDILSPPAGQDFNELLMAKRRAAA